MRIWYLESTADFTFDSVALAGWSLGELGCGITCACLPTIRPLASKFLSMLQRIKKDKEGPPSSVSSIEFAVSLPTLSVQDSGSGV
jgi:hypothetical protein